MKLSSQDRKDLDKYTKFLALKSAQIIIQSRVGEKITTPCKAQTTGTDWFNLHINDLPDVLAETKRALNCELVSTYIPLCVEISLRTTEGDQMVLESWCLSLLPEQCDPTVRIIHTVYNRMGILLKSLVSVTRVTPAYKLSRRQGPESYVICYRIYMDQPQFHNLGDGYKQVRIGQICTPIGTLQLQVAYRTKMTISPTQTGKNNNLMMVKSDHFNSNANNKKTLNNNDDDITDLTKPMNPGPFADFNSKSCIPTELPGVTRLLEMAKSKQESLNINNNNNSKSESESDESTTTTTATKTEEQEDSLIKDDDNKSIKSKESSPTLSLWRGTSLWKSSDEDFWLKELNAPFATETPRGELLKFYRQCKTKPELQSPQKTPTAEEITKMLEMFELKLPEYDALIQSFCESPDN